MINGGEQVVVQNIYKKTPVSIAELNNFFQKNINSGTVFNQVEKEFRNYLQQFSVVKKKVDAVEIIKNQFSQIMKEYQDDLEEQTQNLDDLTLYKKMKKLKKIQTKAWNLNLITLSNIRTICDPKYGVADEWLQRIAQVIKNDYHE